MTHRVTRTTTHKIRPRRHTAVHVRVDDGTATDAHAAMIDHYRRRDQACRLGTGWIEVDAQHAARGTTWTSTTRLEYTDLPAGGGVG